MALDNTSINGSYERLMGPTVTIGNTMGATGSPFGSREDQYKTYLDMYSAKALAERDTAELLNPMLKMQRLSNEYYNNQSIQGMKNIGTDPYGRSMTADQFAQRRYNQSQQTPLSIQEQQRQNDRNAFNMFKYVSGKM